jgi:hypothetical protein
MEKKAADRRKGRGASRIVTSKVISSLAIKRIDAGTLNSALTQIMLLSGCLAQAFKMQVKFPFTIRVMDKRGNCIMIIEVIFDKGTWRSRVLETNLPKSGVGMPIFVLLQDRRGKRVKQLIQHMSRKIVAKECW